MIDFEKTLGLLVDSGVRFVIVGGLAVSIRGSAHVTFNLDVCYARDRQNLERLASALFPLRPRLRGAPPDLPFSLDAETLRSGLNFNLLTDLGDVDLLGEVAGLESYDEVEALLGGRSCSESG